MIRELLERGASSHTSIIVAGEGPALSYDQLRGEVDSLVSTLRRLGIQRTDRIAMALPNGLEMIVSFLAASIAGTAAPLNPAYKTEEFRFYLDDTNAAALIVPKGGAEQARLAAGDRIRLIEIGLDSQGKIQVSWQGAEGKAAGAALPEKDDIALVLHTSGTTSRPKRVPLSHANLMTSTHNVAQTYQLTPEDVSLCVMPLFHVHGLVASTLATLYTGGTIVVMPQFNPFPSGPRPIRTRLPGTPRFPRCTRCCSPAPGRNPREPRTCASYAPAARRWRRKPWTSWNRSSAPPCSKLTG